MNWTTDSATSSGATTIPGPGSRCASWSTPARRWRTTTQAGGAHFLEHMLFNGTEKFPENELIAVLRSFGAGFGADINAYTSYDETVYQLTMPTEDPDVVATGLDVLEQWLSSATIDEAQVESERGVVLDEWRGSAASSDGRIFDALETLVPHRFAVRGQAADRHRCRHHGDDLGTAAVVLRRLVPPGQRRRRRRRRHRSRGDRTATHRPLRSR